MAKQYKLNEKQLHKMISEAISEMADSNGYYEVLNYLHDISGSEDGERIINGLYGESAMGEENAREELRSIFPSVNNNAFEAAIHMFKREVNGNDYDDEYTQYVAESKKKKQVKLNEAQLRDLITKTVKNVLKESSDDNFIFAYGVVQNALIEICENCACTPDEAVSLIQQVFNTFEAEDLVDD